MKTFTLFGGLIVGASAHFVLDYPAARGFDEDTLSQYPCGGQNTVSMNRTSLPIGSPFPIQLDMHHTQANVQVVLATGNAPTGADFTTVLVPTLKESGPQNFCLGAVMAPGDVRDGTNATILVLTNGDDSTQSGLYNCADVTFTSASVSVQDFGAHCQNSTGVRVQALAQDQASISANGTAAGGGSASASASGEGAPAQTGSTSGAGVVRVGSDIVGMGAVLLGAMTGTLMMELW